LGAKKYDLHKYVKIGQCVVDIGAAVGVMGVEAYMMRPVRGRIERKTLRFSKQRSKEKRKRKYRWRH
jgi:hypothetical protein